MHASELGLSQLQSCKHTVLPSPDQMKKSFAQTVNATR